jgi:hypothetical protein
MNAIFQFLKNYEVLIYIGLATLAVWQIRKFLLAWEELRAAAFGLEKESAQMRLNSSAAVLALLLLLTIAEYALVTFITPVYPDLNPLPTPTVDLLVTPTLTLPPAEETEIPILEETAAGEELPITTGCIPGQVDITSPADDSIVSGIVGVEGSVDIPDFGFYKFEIASSGSDNWLTIQAGDEPKVEEELGFWDTTQLNPGPYQLRLIVTDNQGEEWEPCAVQVVVDEFTE